jgi:hypothetical protein
MGSSKLTLTDAVTAIITLAVFCGIVRFWWSIFRRGIPFPWKRFLIGLACSMVGLEILAFIFGK